MDSTFDYDKIKGLSNSLGGRVDLLEKMLGVKVRENLRYSDIQKIVKSGFADEFFDLGDEIMTKYTATDGTEYDFPWRIVDFRDVYWENDPNPHPGMVLQSKYATVERVIFDAPEGTAVDPSETEALEGWYYFGINGYNSTFLNLKPGDTIPHSNYESIYKNTFTSDDPLKKGLNLYSHSALRQWLNANSKKSTWWTEQHLGDMPTSDVDSLNGFAYGLNDEFKSVINPVLVEENVDSTSHTYYNYDRFYIASLSEMYGVEEKAYATQIRTGIEPFKYWKNNSANNKASSSKDANRFFTNLGTDTKTGIWVRKKYLTMFGHSDNVLIQSGVMNISVITESAVQIAPCCVIS